MYNGDTKEFNIDNTDQESVNEIIEIRNGEEIESLDDEINDLKEEPAKEDKTRKRKNPFKKIKELWNNLTKKQKIIAIVISVIVLIIIIVGLVLLFNKSEEENKLEENVVLEADNYRYENGKLYFLDEDGEDIGSYVCKNKKETLCYVAYSDNEDNFDVTKSIYEDETLVNKRINIINDNYVFIYDNETETDGTIMLHSIKENADYESFKLVKQYDLEDDYIIVKDETDNYSLLKFTIDNYEEVLETQYSYLGIITENKEDDKYIVGKKNDKWYLIDYQDKEKTKAINYEIKNYNDSLISVIDEEENYYLYDYKNNQVTEDTYEYINFVNDYVVLVKDKKLFITDKDTNKLYEDGIKLYEEDYNKVNVFNNKTGKLIESRYAFGLSVNNNTIELTINNAGEEEIKLINTLDSVVSTNYDYINYFDGKLYFYSDVEKTNLLGSYECSNANTITSKSSTLGNCYLASNSEFSDNDMNYKKNTIGTLPIFNNRFVFIKDTPELTSTDTMNIVLYDLATDKKLGTYRAIDALNYNGQNGVNFVETTGALLMAKNTKDYYGILKLNLSSVTSLENVKFNDKYKNIEQIKDNYILQKSTGTYYMINSSGEALTSEFSGKIMGYKNNYVKVKNANDYQVFTYDGKELSDKFKYVELYNSIYAAVDSSNKLNLYKYDENISKKPLFTTSIDLKITSNYREGKSFSVKENAGKYIVSVYDSNGTATTYEYPEVVVE